VGRCESDRLSFGFPKFNAALGLASAQTNLGVLCDGAAGVTRDLGEALRWYSAAAERGNAMAQYTWA
jgi:TPR repeat protein